MSAGINAIILSDLAIDICGLKPVKGPCFALIPQYFFNKTSGMCEQFSYGGCRGNENRFKTEDDCKKTCGGNI